MDSATLIGLLIGLGGIIFGNQLEGGHFGSLLQGTAALIVFGGTFGATLVSHNMNDLRRAFRALRAVFQVSREPTRERLAAEVINCAQLARRESILVIERRLVAMPDPFMKTVFRFLIDGVEPEVLRKMFEEDIAVAENQEMIAARVWADAGGFSPTIGIIGAVLGLIHVMANVSDTSALGQGIAVAFVATIYGVGAANLIFIPIANKLKKQVHDRAQTKHMILEGAIAIVSGLNPYIIEQKVRTYLLSSEKAAEKKEA